MNYTDKDIVRFLTNVECLEGLFDTWGVFGHGFNNNLTLGGPTPIGARQANLSQEVASHLAEVALNEQVPQLPPDTHLAMIVLRVGIQSAIDMPEGLFVRLSGIAST